MTAFFSLTIFCSAFLLFCVQPMLAKMILPFLGGSPQVWNTCMVFFQTVLLAAYAYVYVLSSRASVRRQILAHCFLMLMALWALPALFSKDLYPLVGANPTLWLLQRLALWIGAPFFVISATAPLLQSWFSRTDHARSRDPYFLYSASNAGSLLGLLSYPFLIERYSALRAQNTGWRMGFVALMIGVGLCGLWSILRAKAPSVNEGISPQTDPPLRSTLPMRFRWVLLAFVPSSWMLSVTTYLTTDVASIPLFWVIPLAIYLVTLIWAFSGRHDELGRKAVIRWTPIVLLPLVYTMVGEAIGSLKILAPLHLLAFFLGALLCHQELALKRPPVSLLAEYYLWISLGGALGGLANALVAPQIFPGIWEYPLILIVAFALVKRNPSWEAIPSRRKDILYPILLVAFAWGLIEIVESRFAFGLAIAACISFIRSPLRLALGVMGLFWVAFFHEGTQKLTIHRERTFFGVYKITHTKDYEYRQLIHGTTLHGSQSLRPAMMDFPADYYHADGPAGQVFRAYKKTSMGRDAAAIGLGTGSLVKYGKPGGTWTFYEIDPAVERIARHPKYFTYLKRSPVPFQVILGDARLSLREAPSEAYSMMIIDAFGSDAIPVHLLTLEAMELYLSKLKPGGLLLYHISNRHLDLSPVIGNLAHKLRCVALRQRDQEERIINARGLKSSSDWIVVARDRKDLALLSHDSRWKFLLDQPGHRLWTDDYSNVIGVLK